MPDRESELREYDRIAEEGSERLVFGVDEAGRGPLAGPVVAAAVVFPPEARVPGLDDSKRLSAARRQAVALEVRRLALGLGVAFVGPRRIERENIRRATLLAMRHAFLRAEARAGRGTRVLVLVDGLDTIAGLDRAQRAIVGGDATSRAIAAASVIAKTVRDGFMQRLSAEYPGYGFDRNFGYGTAEHLEALRRDGPCPWHRRTFAPIAQGELLPLA